MTYRISRFGWLKDPPDYRDYKVSHAGVIQSVNRIIGRTAKNVVPKREQQSKAGIIRADLRPWCSPVEDQGNIGSCTANATVGALEYFERKTRGEHVDASRLFLYRVTRRYLGWDRKGDTGAFVRSAIKSLKLFGTVPERYWPYDEKQWDVEPEAFHYAYAQNFKALEYYRLDGSIGQIKSALRSGIPVIFGFTCFESIDGDDVQKTGIIPYPGPRENSVGGHAVLAVGYTDSHVIIRNSWGADWGDKGYGYLPWTYFDESHPLADDFWALTNAAWVQDNEADADVKPRRSKSTQGGEAVAVDPKPVSQPTVAEAIAPLIKVVRGTDPIRSVPLRFHHELGLTASPEHEPPPLAKPPKPVSLYLKSVLLKKSFDFQLFWHAVNELYLVAIVWDLSGEPPRVYPQKNVIAEAKGQFSGPDDPTYNVEEGETVRFVGDGIELWPSSTVVGGLYVHLLVMESDGDVRALGKQIESVQKAVKDSGLATALAPLAVAATGISAGTLTAIGVAANALTGVIAKALQDNGDDLVALFDGTYGADRALSDRTEQYDQRGAAITLELHVDASGDAPKARKPTTSKPRRG